MHEPAKELPKHFGNHHQPMAQFDTSPTLNIVAGCDFVTFLDDAGDIARPFTGHRGSERAGVGVEATKVDANVEREAWGDAENRRSAHVKGVVAVSPG